MHGTHAAQERTGDGDSAVVLHHGNDGPRPRPTPREHAEAGRTTSEGLDSTFRHGRRVAALVWALVRDAVPPRRARRLARAAYLHDIGKAVVPDALLAKTDPLTEEERAVLRRHPVMGERLLSEWDSKTARLAQRVARSHHERWDGSGYPDGLRRRQIPLAARVTGVADALDVMTQGRPYCSPKSILESVEEIREGAGRQFDPWGVQLITDSATGVRDVIRRQM